MVYVAGAKVRTDLFTIPFSKGLNLICIHSKKYIDEDPETKGAKTAENVGAMKVSGGHRMRIPEPRQAPWFSSDPTEPWWGWWVGRSVWEDRLER